ncbi:RING-7 protein [Diaporthe helianthi]|uniref:RING-7 protein n=1 Tax=Diaporthe helianthi TaxID=158607 RepID=A0A2P5HG39_DIAHE|nr:RING-7 protein [Diaporthe helianthi]
MGGHWALAVPLAIAGVRCAESEMAGTHTMQHVLDWQRNSEMQLLISASELDPVPLTYTVIPLTTNLGLNESQLVRGVDIKGRVVAADTSNYADISGSDVIPYLCCDQQNATTQGNLDPNAVLNALMDNDPPPAAILLYSQQGMCCGLTGNLRFNRVLTMADKGEANQTLNMANMSQGTVRAQISGNATETQQDNSAGQQGGNNSAVAMSILYSITGLITLLFLIIIATGAIRAHRYPERYGPRNAFGGRPRQSRAKGLARAVLETIPIVKFGDSQPKPDPNLELENATSQQRAGSIADHQSPEDGSNRHLSTIPESPLNSPLRPAPAASGALGSGSDSEADAVDASRVAQHGTETTSDGAQTEEGLGCSICTDDFTVGEDVRVLPCNHKFHPPCVDPWLVNVSGTCPLCRLDLRPEQGESGDDERNENSEAPPLGADVNDTGESLNSSRSRSRLFDLHRLRHATVEERIEVLRRYRTEQRSGSSASNDEEGRDRSGLTNRLREKFRIRTRAVQRSSQQTGSTSSPSTTTAAANQS